MPLRLGDRVQLGVAWLLVGAAVLLWPARPVRRARLRGNGEPPLGGHGSTDRRVAFALDLAAAALQGGRPVDQALLLAAPAVPGAAGEAITQVARLLRLGAGPVEAWRPAAPHAVLAPVARTAMRSASSGARLARAWEQLAAELRDQLRASAEARAHRAGVLAMAPLGLCFLPAFVCLGVVPVVVGIARSAFAGLP